MRCLTRYNVARRCIMFPHPPPVCQSMALLVAVIFVFGSERVKIQTEYTLEDIVTKGETTRYEQFLLLSQCFQDPICCQTPASALD